MKITFAIKPHEDTNELNFGDIEIFHVECTNEPILINRNPVTEKYLLHCKKCGLRIELKTNENINNFIFKTCIDEQPRILSSSEFSSDFDDEIELILTKKQA